MSAAVSVLAVHEPTVWDELDAIVPLTAHLGERLDPLRCVVLPSFVGDVLPALRGVVLVRYAHRTAVDEARIVADLTEKIRGLPIGGERVLVQAQRHAVDAVVLGRQAWDVDRDAALVRALVGSGLLSPLPGDAPAYEGRYALHPDLPPPPLVPYDMAEAAMGLTDDLSAPSAGPIALLHDLSSLAAAIDHEAPARTATGTLRKADARRLGRRLGDEEVVDAGALSDRWSLAMRGLEALGAVDVDPLQRTLAVSPDLERVLTGDDAEACDRLVHRLVDRDLHSLLPAVRAALAAAGEGAVDEVVFMELLQEQHRHVLFPGWRREGVDVYPVVGDEPPRPMDEDGWDRVETRMVRALLRRVARLGLIRTASGVFAATRDGRRWADADAVVRPPVWITGDAELIVPPDAVTPWERFQLERLGRCLRRDVVDTYRLERAGLVRWLAFHDVDEALALLARRCPSVPDGVVETLCGWARTAGRAVLTHGVVLPEITPPRR